MKKKVCKSCRLFVEGSECPICHGVNFVANWKGMISVIDAEKSVIAKKIGIGAKGDYALKIK